MNTPSPGDTFDEELPAWAAEADDHLADGDPEAALQSLATAPDDDPLRFLIESRAHVELDQVDAAYASLDRLRPLLGPTHPEVRRTEATLAILTWKIDEARTALYALDPEEEDASYFVDLSVLADLAEDHDGAHELLLEAHQRDPEQAPEPVRLSPEDFEAVVAKAIDGLPEPFQRVFEDTPVIIDPMPTAEIVGAPASGHAPDILGLFMGRMATEEEISGELPPRIYLFQRNLERAVASVEELEEEIAITVYHELGHALGFDEDGVDEMGWG